MPVSACSPVVRLACGLCLVFAVAAPAAAQGRVSGTVRDEYGEPIKGATVVAENPLTAPTRFTTVTDDRGRFGMLGLRGGRWTLTVTAPGYEPVRGDVAIRGLGSNPPFSVQLLHVSAAPPLVLAGVDSAALQARLAEAAGLMDTGRYEEAVEAYRGILATAAALTTVHLQIGRALRTLGRADEAVAEFEQVPRSDPAAPRAQIEIARTDLVRGRRDEAIARLEEVAGAGAGTRDAEEARALLAQLRK